MTTTSFDPLKALLNEIEPNEVPAHVMAAMFLSSVAVSLPYGDAAERLEPFVARLAKILQGRDDRISELRKRLEMAERTLRDQRWRGWSR